MDYRKLDAALAGEIDGAAPSAKLSVFIHTSEPLTDAQTAELATMGVLIHSPSAAVLTGSAPASALDRLSELPWIRRIALAKKLRPLDDSSA